MSGKLPVFPSCLPWRRFVEFVENENRFESLESVLRETGLRYSIVRLNGGGRPAAHFFISAASARVTRPAAALLAHYDCAPGSPGANDNATGVFILIETALKLNELGLDNWLIILTDKEELGLGDSLREQGSFLLANFFRTQKYGSPRFYIFDSCGCGDTLVISTTADYLLKTENSAALIDLKKDLYTLRHNAMAKAKETMQKFLLLPAPFSDDAGFLRAGLASQLITALPAWEASNFASLARKNPLYVNSLVNMNLKRKRDQNLFPETWRIINTPADEISRLNPEHFGAIVRFATALCSA